MQMIEEQRFQVCLDCHGFAELFETIKRIGSGTHGNVYEVKARKLGLSFAAKMSSIYCNKHDTERRIYEALGTNLQHIIGYIGEINITHIKKVHIFELCCCDLFKLINEGMPTLTKHRLICELQNAVQFIHSKGIVHRDIKPENCLISLYGTLKLCDFGLSTHGKLQNGQILVKGHRGTKQYSAPEAWFNNDQYYDGIAADIWSIGITAHAVLQKTALFLEYSNAFEHIESFYKQGIVSKYVMQCLQKCPAERKLLLPCNIK